MDQIEFPLKAARIARGWSQSKAADELAALAAARGVAVAAPASLKTQLSRWENQHALPEEHYRALLQELYQRSEAELGLVLPPVTSETSESGAEILRARLAAATAIDDAALELLHGQLRATRELDNRLGTAGAAGPARAQLTYVEEALRHTLDSGNRRQLGALLVDAATLCGRHALDRNQPEEAWQCYETAKIGAREADSGPLLGYALAEQATVLIEVGKPRAAVSTVEEAISVGFHQASAPLRAAFEAALGKAMAASGAAREARDAYRKAESELSSGRGGVDLAFPRLSLPSFDLTALHRHRGHANRLLREHNSAIQDLQTAVGSSAVSAREVAEAHADLALAHGALGDEAKAALHARTARDLATKLGSPRLAALLDSRPTKASSPEIKMS